MSKNCIITTVKGKIKGNATSYIEKENEIFIPVSKKFTLKQTRAMAQDKVNKINKEYLSEKFGEVVSLNSSYTDGTGINIHPSQRLVEAYEVKEGNKTIEEVNRLDFFNGDKALLEQEEKENLVTDSKQAVNQVVKPGVQELFESNSEFAAIGTPEQYSQYLESLNKPNTNPILQGNQTNVEEIITQLEKDGLLEIDCKGKLKAEKGLVTSFTKGGIWKVIKDLKGYPTHKEGGVDLTIGKDGVKIKNGNTQFIAKHGLVIPKN